MRLSTVVTSVGRSVLVWLSLGAGVVSAHAQQGNVTHVTATSTAGAAAIVLDGELNDAGWQSANP
jgi:hypothetical protein